MAPRIRARLRHRWLGRLDYRLWVLTGGARRYRRRYTADWWDEQADG